MNKLQRCASAFILKKFWRKKFFISEILSSKIKSCTSRAFYEANTKEMGVFPVIRQIISWFCKFWVHSWSLLAFSYLLDRKLPPSHTRYHDTGISQASCTLRSIEERQTQAWRYQPVQDKPCFRHGSVCVLVVKCECLPCFHTGRNNFALVLFWDTMFSSPIVCIVET